MVLYYFNLNTTCTSMSCFSLLLLLQAVFVNSSLRPSNDPRVKTHTGTYVGLVNETTPHVRQFLNVPYALPPVGPRRWLPAESVPLNDSAVIDSTSFSPFCPQYLSGAANAFNQLLPGYLIPTGLNTSAPAAMPPTAGEDCLSLSIWTPTGDVSNLPVIIFMTGGGFIIGGINIPYQLPHHWVERTRSHIVISINYRLGIMGFPNARGLSSQNLGISDQRMAHEWVRDNIKAFGGDPEKITLWGQSAGGMSTDFHGFAFHDDFIAKGQVMESGTALLPLRSYDIAGTNFSFVASKLGCGGLSSTTELDCMRQKPVEAIVNFVGTYGDTGTLPALSFSPTADEKLVFSNYTDRYAKGLVARVPAIVGTATDEGTVLVPYAKEGVDQDVVDLVTWLNFLCPAHETSSLRAELGLRTYRYQYDGNFTNLSPLPWLGAYHSSDLPMFFGTYSDSSKKQNLKLESRTSEVMQDFLLEFMLDPVDRLAQKGWPDYVTDRGLRFGSNGTPSKPFVVDSIDNVCSGLSLA